MLEEKIRSLKCGLGIVALSYILSCSGVKQDYKPRLIYGKPKLICIETKERKECYNPAIVVEF